MAPPVVLDVSDGAEGHRRDAADAMLVQPWQHGARKGGERQALQRCHQRHREARRGQPPRLDAAACSATSPSM